MNVTRLRQLIKRRGNLGVLVAGLHLAAHYVWSRHRRMVAVCVFGIAATTLSLVHAPRVPLRATTVLKPVPPSISTPQPASDEPPEQSEAAPHVKLPYPHLQLIPRSREVAALNDHYCGYAWLSPTCLMLVWSDVPTKSLQWDNYESWIGRAEELDTKRGRRHALMGLTKVFRQPIGIPWDFKLAPSGEWLEWKYQSTGDCWPFPAAARLDGSGFQQWTEDRFVDAGWLDDHRWAAVGMRDSEVKENSNPVTIQDLVHQSSNVVKASSHVGLNIAHQIRELNGGDIYDGQGLEEPIEIDMSVAKVVVARQHAPQEISHGRLRIEGVTIFRAHHTQRTYYVARFAESTVAPHGRRDTCLEALYVSDSEDRGAREIGFVRSKPYRDDEDYGEMRTLTDVKWLPDDRHISFIYKKKLYVVKAPT